MLPFAVKKGIPVLFIDALRSKEPTFGRGVPNIIYLFIIVVVFLKYIFNSFLLLMCYKCNPKCHKSNV